MKVAVPGLKLLSIHILTQGRKKELMLSDYESQYHSDNRSGSQWCLVHGGAGGVTGLVVVWSPLLGGRHQDRQELGGVSVSPGSLTASSDRQRYQGAAWK